MLRTETTTDSPLKFLGFIIALPFIIIGAVSGCAWCGLVMGFQEVVNDK